MKCIFHIFLCIRLMIASKITHITNVGFVGLSPSALVCHRCRTAESKERRAQKWIRSFLRGRRLRPFRSRAPSCGRPRRRPPTGGHRRSVRSAFVPFRPSFVAEWRLIFKGRGIRVRWRRFRSSVVFRPQTTTTPLRCPPRRRRSTTPGSRR